MFKAKLRGLLLALILVFVIVPVCRFLSAILGQIPKSVFNILGWGGLALLILFVHGMSLIG
jgi:hypothetical protein